MDSAAVLSYGFPFLLKDQDILKLKSIRIKRYYTCYRFIFPDTFKFLFFRYPLTG